MKIIAFDLGATTGFAAHKTCGHILFSGERVERLSKAKKWFAALSWAQFDAVVYETPLTRGQAATRSLWGLAGILEATVGEVPLPILDIAVPTIKKFATGNGMASKDQMIAAARDYGYRVSNEHEADAVCLLQYAEKHLEKV